MTQFFRSSPRDADGEARLALLMQWVAADQAAGRSDLSVALTLWRDDVTKRVRPARPQKIRIPWIFEGNLQLGSPYVLLVEDDAVCLIAEKGNGRYIPGRTLIAGRRQ